jgi:hypothetical protein
MQSYISKALVDMAEGEIVLKTQEELVPRQTAVGTVAGGEES